VEWTPGSDVECSHCGQMVPPMPFCPNCGLARRAGPKLGTARLGRTVR